MSSDESQSYRDEILAGLVEGAREVLGYFDDKHPMSGARLLSRFAVGRTEIGGRQTISVSPENAAKLTELAKKDPFAFDLASQLAGLCLLGQLESRLLHKNIPLQLFAAGVLVGSFKRPKRLGRKHSPDTFVKVMQYGLCKLTARNTRFYLTRSREGVHGQESACDLVALAFSNSGKHTTYEQLESICFTENYKHIRDLASWLELD